MCLDIFQSFLYLDSAPQSKCFELQEHFALNTDFPVTSVSTNRPVKQEVLEDVEFDMIKKKHTSSKNNFTMSK